MTEGIPIVGVKIGILQDSWRLELERANGETTIWGEKYFDLREALKDGESLALDLDLPFRPPSGLKARWIVILQSGKVLSEFFESRSRAVDAARAGDFADYQIAEILGGLR